MDEIFHWQDKRKQFEKLTSQSMLGRNPTQKVGIYHNTPVPYLGHQGTHSVDYASPISLDLKCLFCKNEEIK